MNPGGEADSLQPDSEYYARFDFIDDPDRRANHAMVALMDDVVGNVTAAINASLGWDNTLILWSSDNGGAVHLGGGANVWPLRGGYCESWPNAVLRPSRLLLSPPSRLLLGPFVPSPAHAVNLV